MTEASAKKDLGEVCREISFAFSCPYDTSLKVWPKSKAKIGLISWQFHRRWANLSFAKKNAKILPATDDRKLDALEAALRKENFLGTTYANALHAAHEAWKKARTK